MCVTAGAQKTFNDCGLNLENTHFAVRGVVTVSISSVILSLGIIYSLILCFLLRFRISWHKVTNENIKEGNYVEYTLADLLKDFAGSAFCS